MGLLQELQRRKVVRTALAYLAAAFVTAQAVQLLVDGLELPSWILKVVLIALVVLLPLVVGLAWAFDLTAEGLQKTGADSSKAKLALSWRRLALPAGASVLLLATAVAFVALEKPKTAELNQNLIAVMPFRVAGDAQMAYLRDGMVDLLAAKLTGEGGPRAADPRAVLSAVKRVAKDSDVDENLATEVGAELGAGRVLVGSIVGTARELQISAKVLDTSDGRVIVEGVQPGSADSLLMTVDRLVAKLLSLQAGEGSQRLDVLTTTSLSALRAYLDGQAAFRNGHFARAIELFGRAMDDDSTFALAAMGQWVATGWGEGPPVDYAKLRRILRANRERLSSVDKLFAHAMTAGDSSLTVADRLADFEAVVKAAPDRADAWFEYADFMMHYGALASQQDGFERADAGFSRVLQLDSTYLPALLHRMDVSFLRGRIEGFRKLEPVRKRLDPDGSAALYHTSWRAHILADSAALKVEHAAVDTMSGDRLWMVGFIGITGSGAASVAAKALDRRVQVAATTDERSRALIDAAVLYLNYGMPQRAARAFDDLLATSDDRSWVNESQVLAALYENGDTASAVRAVKRLEDALKGESDVRASVRGACALEQWRLWHGNTTSLRGTVEKLERVPSDNRFVKLEAEICAGVLATIDAAMRGGSDLGARAQALDQQLEKGPRIDGRFRHAASIALARAAERAGDRKLAYRAMSRFAFHPEMFMLTSTMFRESARLAALNGERDKAITNYTLYLNLHENAEPALRAEVDAARKHLAEITGERR